MSLGCQEAFEVFKRDHADSITIEDNKQLLKQRRVSHQNTAGGRHLKVHQQSGQELVILHQTSQASVEDSLQAFHLFLLKTFHIQKTLSGDRSLHRNENNMRNLSAYFHSFYSSSQPC